MDLGLDTEALKNDLVGSGLFDGVWYLQRYGDVAAAGKEPLQHFIEYGWVEGRWPNRYFDPDWYRQEHPDVATAGGDPLLQYMRQGERRERRPHRLFDPVWYRAAYEVPKESLAFGHFVANVRSGRVVPNADLFAVPLLTGYRDDAANGVDPVAHYLDDCGAAAACDVPDLAVVQASRLVDDNYYLINSNDVLEAGVDPAEHYCRHGWREGRRPNVYFDAVWYLQTNPDIARLKVNPLTHYILAGEAADRRPVPFFDPGWYRAEYRIPADKGALGHYLAHRREQIHSPTPLFDVALYVERYGLEIGPHRDPFMHFLQAGVTRDIDPSAGFDAAGYRRAHLGRPSRGFARVIRADQHNPLVHYLRAEYAGRNRDA